MKRRIAIITGALALALGAGHAAANNGHHCEGETCSTPATTTTQPGSSSTSPTTSVVTLPPTTVESSPTTSSTVSPSEPEDSSPSTTECVSRNFATGGCNPNTQPDDCLVIDPVTGIGHTFVGFISCGPGVDQQPVIVPKPAPADSPLSVPTPTMPAGGLPETL